jgi:hypothetical protein
MTEPSTGMKGALIFTCIGLCFLVLLFAPATFFPRNDSIDIHVFDSYVITTYGSLIGFICLTLATCFSLGGVIGSFFKSRNYWLMFLIIFSLDVYFIMQYKFWNFFS